MPSRSCSVCHQKMLIKNKDWKYIHQDFDLFCSKHCFLVALVNAPRRKRSKFKRHSKEQLLNGGSIWSPKHRMSFRSNYELRVANFFDTCGFKYQYEPYIFEWEGHVYTPDFYIVDHNCFIEVKGMFGFGKRKKLSNFVENHPEVNLLLLPWTLHSEFKK